MHINILITVPTRTNVTSDVRTSCCSVVTNVIFFYWENFLLKKHNFQEKTVPPFTYTTNVMFCFVICIANFTSYYHPFQTPKVIVGWYGDHDTIWNASTGTEIRLSWEEKLTCGTQAQRDDWLLRELFKNAVSTAMSTYKSNHILTNNVYGRKTVRVVVGRYYYAFCWRDGEKPRKLETGYMTQIPCKVLIVMELDENRAYSSWVGETLVSGYIHRW
jgi:hypothetical protein